MSGLSPKTSAAPPVPRTRQSQLLSPQISDPTVCPLIHPAQKYSVETGNRHQAPSNPSVYDFPQKTLAVICEDLKFQFTRATIEQAAKTDTEPDGAAVGAHLADLLLTGWDEVTMIASSSGIISINAR